MRCQQVFNNGYFRAYASEDVIGAEVGGAFKNVVALAAGVASGLGLGDNSKALLITRGLSEMTRLGVAMGGEPAELEPPPELVTVANGPMLVPITVWFVAVTT